MTRRQLYLAARDGVNRIRRKFGYSPVSQLPAGRVSSASNCPVAKALPYGFRVVPDNARGDGYFKAVGDYGREIPLDYATSWFVKAFDQGEFKELAA